MKEWDGNIIVLLCGITDANLAKALRNHVKDWIGAVVVDPKVTVVQKCSG